MSAQRGARLVAKQALDRAVAASLLAVTSPLMLCAAIAVAISMGRPVLFVQERPGKGARPFRLLKFRTMRDAVGPNGQPLPDAERMTRVGHFLRATSIDELPQLLNVLRGELSLVGPRPLLMRYVSRYSREQWRRHDVLPGITGWAQVNGRNAQSWPRRFELDVWYVDHWSLLLDLQILARTVQTVASRRGIANEGHATMPEFMGAEGT